MNTEKRTGADIIGRRGANEERETREENLADILSYSHAYSDAPNVAYLRR